jgi:hypothetical protein
MAKITRTSKRALIWPAMSLLLLGGMLAEARTRIQPADAEPHLARAKAAIEAVPMTIGPWSGHDEPVPAAAVSLLRPNMILSRKYAYVSKDGPFADKSVELLIVNCSDARDLQGHYPPNCYPAAGEPLLRKDWRTWVLKDAAGAQSDLQIHGMEYEFSPRQTKGEGSASDDLIVYNFFVLPLVPGTMVSHPELNGAICPDIDSVYTSGEDYQRRYFGAAEFQMVTDAELSREQRDEIFTELLAPNMTMIRTLMNRDPGGK